MTSGSEKDAKVRLQFSAHLFFEKYLPIALSFGD